MAHPQVIGTKKWLLVDALLNIDHMRDQQRRHQIMVELGHQLKQPLDVARSNVDRFDVLAMVDACASRPGSLWQLVDVLEFFARGTAAVDDLKRLLETMTPRPWLSAAALHGLYDLTAQARCGRTRALWEVAVGEHGPPLTTSPDDLESVVSELEALPLPVGRLHPLIVFVEFLAMDSDPRLAVQFREWCDTAAQHLEVTELLLDLRRHPPAPRRQRLFLVVRLQGDGVNAAQYLLSAWLQRDTDPGVPIRRDDRRRTLAEAEQELDELLTLASDVLPEDAGGLMVEFIFPRDLLGTPVDQWRIGRSEAGGWPLGIEHPVVVRDLERLGRKILHHRWRQRWARLQAQGDRTDQGAVRWIHQPGQVRHDVLLSDLVREDDIPVCVVLGFTPAFDGSGLGRAELHASLHSGTPVVLWRRDGGDPAALDRLLAPGTLRDLPETARRLRADAVGSEGGEDHLGLHLTLISDDASRVPVPPFVYSAPA